MNTFKPLIILISITLIISCNSKKKSEKDSPDTKKAELLGCELEMFKAFGNFDTLKDTLNLNIPVADSDFEIKETANISANSTNALLVRVTNEDEASVMTEPVKDTILKKYSLKNLGLDKTDLKKDRKFKIIVYNTVDNLSEEIIAGFKDCIRENPVYEPCKCISEINKFRPKDVNGSILNGR